MKFCTFLSFTLLFTAFAVKAEERYVYIGTDVLYRQSEFKKGYGRDLFNTKAPNCHIFMGIRASEYLSFEMGEIISPTNMKLIAVKRPKQVLGVKSRNLPEYHLMRSTMRGFTTGAMWHLPMSWFEKRVEGLLYTGLSILRCKYMDSVISDNTGPFDLGNTVRTFTYRTGVPRIAFGVHIIENNIGLRVMSGVDHTRLFKVVMPQQQSKKTVHMKDSYFAGIGFFVKYP